MEYVPKVILGHHKEFDKSAPCCTSVYLNQNGYCWHPPHLVLLSHILEVAARTEWVCQSFDWRGGSYHRYRPEIPEPAPSLSQHGALIGVFRFFPIHSKTPHVVTVLWLDSDDVVTILSSTRNLVEGYKTVYLCHLDSYTVTVCNGYLVSSHTVTVSCLLGA